MPFNMLEFQRDLEQDLHSDTSGYFRRLLVAQCNAGREETASVDVAQADKDAKDIYQVSTSVLYYF